MDKVKKPTKASTAREFMEKIGAFQKVPPIGWAKKVEDHLEENGFKSSPSGKMQVYSIRWQAMKDKLGGSKNGIKNGIKEVFIEKAKKNPGNKVSVGDLASAKKFAYSNGGITKCIEVLKALDSLINS